MEPSPTRAQYSSPQNLTLKSAGVGLGAEKRRACHYPPNTLGTGSAWAVVSPKDPASAKHVQPQDHEEGDWAVNNSNKSDVSKMQM